MEQLGGAATLVWSVKALNDGNTIVSGDSLGHTAFWDLSFGTLLQSFNIVSSRCCVVNLKFCLLQHKADVMSVVVCGDDLVYASGVDSMVSLFT